MMQMPSVNIFIISKMPEMEEMKEKENNKERLLSKALKNKTDVSKSMLAQLKEMTGKLGQLPSTSHVGGG